MKSILFIICMLSFSMAYCQERKVYPFFVELNHFSNAPKFRQEGGRMIYDGFNEKEKAFFSRYEILEFYQAFPDSRRPRTLNTFTVQSFSNTLMNDMVNEFPEKYVRVEDLSGIKMELADSYTNDYGTTLPPSEGQNQGISLSSANYDYINLPKAWDYTYGSSNVIIGISDTGFDITDDDFEFKSTIMPGAANPSYNLIDSGHWHATFVASIAAAQGDNQHGMVGVCSECSILYSFWTYGSPGTEAVPLPNTNKLLQMAISGAKVINMSWLSGGATTTIPNTTYQWIFDELHDDYNMVLVAGAGNNNPWDINPTNGILYYYPASYNHVISVSGVNHKNDWSEETIIDPTYGEVSLYVKDMISPSVATDYPIGNGPYGFYESVTTNDRVDIVAPAYYIPVYPWEVLNDPEHRYGIGSTSGATPHVTGTVGLMLSLNDCLINDEIEDIIQLTAKNIEAVQGNQPFIGKLGAGKLETGDAVEFVYEMMQSTGNALIAGQDFYRFNFNLSHINNKLTLSNQKFRDNCTADFTAKAVIDILSDCDFKPNDTGFIDLKIDGDISVCDGGGMPRMNIQKDQSKESFIVIATKLYPNPNDGTFQITTGDKLSGTISLEVLDISGKIVYKDSQASGTIINVKIPNLSAGMYIAKLTSGDHQETIKFIKQ